MAPLLVLESVILVPTHAVTVDTVAVTVGLEYKTRALVSALAVPEHPAADAVTVYTPASADATDPIPAAVMEVLPETAVPPAWPVHR